MTDQPKGSFRKAKPNKMFPVEIRYLIRFYVAAKGEQLPACAACNKKRRARWTMLCPFVAKEFGAFTLTDLGEFLPLTLVCSDHPIGPTQAIVEALAGYTEENL